jgi:hypothetical protein
MDSSVVFSNELEASICGKCTGAPTANVAVAVAVAVAISGAAAVETAAGKASEEEDARVSDVCIESTGVEACLDFFCFPSGRPKKSSMTRFFEEEEEAEAAAGDNIFFNDGKKIQDVLPDTIRQVKVRNLECKSSMSLSMPVSALLCVCCYVCVCVRVSD